VLGVFFLRLSVSVEMTNKSEMKQSTSFSINFRSAPYATGATVMTSALPTSLIAGVLNGSGNAQQCALLEHEKYEFQSSS
jgi:hypothetical protein